MIGLGTDVVDIDRFRRVLARTPALEGRLFTPTERAVASERRDPIPALAVRFAAKEAVMKVLGVGLGAVDWHDVEVVREPSGRPRLEVSGRARILAERSGISRWHVSLSHSDLVAQAVAAGE